MSGTVDATGAGATINLLNQLGALKLPEGAELKSIKAGAFLDAVDGDRDGALNLGELAARLPGGEKAAMAMINAYDADRDSKLDSGELASALLDYAMGKQESTGAVLDKNDGDGDGKLDAEELGTLMKTMAQSDATAKTLIEKFDADGDGSLDSAELKQALQYLRAQGAMAGAPEGEDAPMTPEALLKAYDADGDGLLDSQELSSLAEKTGMAIGAMLDTYDADGDGKLDSRELAAMSAKMSGSGSDAAADEASAPDEAPAADEPAGISPGAFIDRYDTNKDGTLDAEELDAGGMKSQDVLAKSDANGDGTLDSSEAVELAAQSDGAGGGYAGGRARPGDSAADIVAYYDKDGDGALNSGELAELAAAYGVTPGTLTGQADTGRDGKVDAAELARLLTLPESSPSGAADAAAQPKTLDDIFASLDADNDGVLSGSEVTMLREKHLTGAKADEDVLKVISTDGNQTISAAELTAYVERNSAPS